MKAIVSVYDKAGLADFAQGLVDLGFEVFSTGGTKKSLQESKVPVHSVSDITGFPEILDGRVKTLHPAIHGGILARRDVPGHLSQLKEVKIGLIDLVAVNLYPFVQTISRPGVTLEDALENIDIGGPTMVRAAAKNFPHVLVVVDPVDYGTVLQKLKQGSVDINYRRHLAQKAFQHVASYDTAIARYLFEGEGFPQEMTIALRKRQDLRYGENSHQKAAFYIEAGPDSIGMEHNLAKATQIIGPELSFNNILDLEAAVSVASDFAAPTIAIIKHNNPCGLASHSELVEAYRRALAGDPVAAFGGVVGINRPVDKGLAQEIDKTHYDAIVAPEYSREALAIFQPKKNLRLIALPGMVSPPRDEVRLDYRRVRGGLLVQTWDTISGKEFQGKVVTKRGPTPKEMEDLAFAWRAVKHIKSNAIVLAKDKTLLGMGAGQPSRVVSMELALKRAGTAASGAVVGSDAFFPFSDGVELAAKAGVTAIMQPGGSVKDEDAIKVANQYNIAMVFTGQRHFKH